MINNKILKKFCFLLFVFILIASCANARENDAPIGGLYIREKTILSNGQKATNTQNVIVDITAIDTGSGVKRIANANEDDLNQLNWISWSDSSLGTTPDPNVKTRNWTLSNGDGSKTVYLIIEDNDDNTTVTFNNNFNYTITYDMKGGTGGPSGDTKKIGIAYTIPSTIPTKTNYTFKGWDTESAGETVVYSPGDGYYKNEDITLYAVWKNNYTIKFNGNNNTSGTMADLDMVYGDAKNLTTNAFARTGYDFNGWNTKPDETGINYSDGQNVNNLTSTAGGVFDLYARWAEKTATLTYNANGHGTAPSAVTMKYSTATKAASAITATGYTFNGWNTKANGSGTSYAAGATVKAANVVPTATTLYAQWTEKTATLTYNANGHGTAPSEVTMKYSTATKAASAITANGYTFGGWNTKANGSGTSYAAGATVKAANVVPTATTLYAQWTTASLTVPLTVTGRINYEQNGNSGTMASGTISNYYVLNINGNNASITNGNTIKEGGYSANDYWAPDTWTVGTQAKITAGTPSVSGNWTCKINVTGALYWGAPDGPADTTDTENPRIYAGTKQFTIKCNGTSITVTPNTEQVFKKFTEIWASQYFATAWKIEKITVSSFNWD